MLTIPSAVEDALKNGAQKNFRVHFPNGERADITNDNIVSESVSFTESICSQSELKFGLAEASVLEFETVGVENIRGAEIEASIEIVTEWGTNVITLPYSISAGSSTTINGIRYTVNADGSITANGTATGKSVFELRTSSMAGYQLEDKTYRFSGCPRGGGEGSYRLSVTANQVNFYYDNGSGIDYRYHGTSIVSPAIEIASGTTVNNLVFTPKLIEECSIPYGRFIVDECKRQTNLERRKMVAYSVGMQFEERYTKFENFRRNLKVSTNTPMQIMALSTALMNLRIKGKFEPFTYTSCKDEWTVQIPFYDSSNYFEFSCMRTGWHGGFMYFDYKKPNFTTTELINLIRSQISGVHNIEKIEEMYNYMSDCICFFPNGAETRYDLYALTADSFYFDPNGVEQTASASAVGILTKVYVNGIGFPIRNSSDYDFFDANNTSGVFNYNSLYIPRKKVGSNEYICEKNLDYTMNDILVGCIEILGCFGRRKRDGNFDIISLNDNFSTPDYELSKSDYSQCWYEEAPTLPYGKVECFYKDLNDEDAYISKRIQNVNPCLVYDLSENLFVKNTRFSSAQIQTLIDIFASNVTNISYIGSDISAVGLPFIEAGDVLEVEVGNNETIKTFIEKRTISGVQALFDDISAEANEDYIGEWVEEEETVLMLIENGLCQNGFSFVGKAYRSSINGSNGVTGTPTITENYTGGVVRAYHSATASNGNRACSICSSEKIDLTDYSTLHIEYNYSTYHASTTATYVAFVIPTSTMATQGYAVTKSYQVCYHNTQGEFTHSGTADIDVSELNGEYYIGADITYRPGSSNGYTDMRIKNMWLE